MMDLSSHIDHTLLKPDADLSSVETLCDEAKIHQFAAVCVNPYWVPVAAERLKDVSVRVCCVVGFPLGATPTEVKRVEAEWCLKHGADEIDMVMNIGEAKSGNWNVVENDIRSLSELTRERSALLKVIFETFLLDEAEIAASCEASINAGADFVKTSTGFSGGGATRKAVRMMVEATRGACRVKASGGIRDRETAVEMINIGAERLGTSSGVAIVSGKTGSEAY